MTDSPLLRRPKNYVAFSTPPIGRKVDQTCEVVIEGLGISSLVSSPQVSKEPTVGQKNRGRRSRGNDGARIISLDKKLDGALVQDSLYDQNNLKKSCYTQLYQERYVLGKGTFGQVVQVHHKKSAEKFAVKIARSSHSGRSQLHKEIEINQLLSKHPNLVSLTIAWEELGTVYMTFESCLVNFEAIENMLKKADRNLSMRFFFDALKGLKHLHSKKILHLDLKPANLVLGYDYSCKICDFGCAIYFGEVPDIVPDSDFKAPELDQNIFTVKADIYSLAITFQHNFECTHPAIPSMLLADREERPTAEQVLESSTADMKTAYEKTEKYMPELIQQLRKIEPESSPEVVEFWKKEILKNKLNQPSPDNEAAVGISPVATKRKKLMRPVKLIYSHTLDESDASDASDSKASPPKCIKFDMDDADTEGMEF